MNTLQDNLKDKLSNKFLSKKDTTSVQVKSKVASVITIDKELIDEINWKIDLVLKGNNRDIFQLELLHDIDSLKLDLFEYLPKIKECVTKILMDIPILNNKVPGCYLLNYTDLINKILTKNEIFDIFVEKSKLLIHSGKFDDKTLEEGILTLKSFGFDYLSHYKYKNTINKEIEKLSEENKNKIKTKNTDNLINDVLGGSPQDWEKLDLLGRFEAEMLGKDSNISGKFPKIKECIVEILKTLPLNGVIYSKRLENSIGKPYIVKRLLEKQLTSYINLIKKFLAKEEIEDILRSRIIKDKGKIAYFRKFFGEENLKLTPKNREILGKILECFGIESILFFHPGLKRNLLGLEGTKENKTYSERILSSNSPNVIKTMKEFPNIKAANIIYKSGEIIECLISTKNGITVVEPIEPNYAAFAIDEKNFKKNIKLDPNTILIHFDKIPHERITHHNNGKTFLMDYVEL